MYGIDLDKELSKGRYGWLLDRILDLPDPYSRFREAMSEDEEYAELLLSLEESRDNDEGPSATLRYSQVGLQERLLMSIDTGIKAMRTEAAYIASQGKGNKPQPPEPWPLPQTAVERLRAQRQKQEADGLAQLFGVKPEDL